MFEKMHHGSYRKVENVEQREIHFNSNNCNFLKYRTILNKSCIINNNFKLSQLSAFSPKENSTTVNSYMTYLWDLDNNGGEWATVVSWTCPFIYIHWNQGIKVSNISTNTNFLKTKDVKNKLQMLHLTRTNNRYTTWYMVSQLRWELVNSISNKWWLR